jgi:hypothetical protein
MKIQLDTKEKVIRIEEKVNLKDFMDVIKKILPDIWKEYTLETNSVINWTNPIVIERFPVYPEVYPWWPPYPIVTCDTSATITTSDVQTTGDGLSSKYSLPNTYNIEISYGRY